MGCKLVIFDFDGTIADTFPWLVSIFNEVADKYRFKRLDQNHLDVLRNLDMRQIISHHQIPFRKLPFIVRYVHMLMERDIASITLFPGIEKVLFELSQAGVILAIITSNSYANVLKVLGPENAAQFSYFECGVSLFGKRAKLKKILVMSRIASEMSILIGDELRDAQAALQAGISFGAVAWGYSHINSLISYGTKEIFFHVEELLQKLIPQIE